MRAVVVECLLPNASPKAEETRIMAQTIGYNVLELLFQRRKSEHHSYCIGPGKLDELERVVDEKQVDVVIFANTLPSSQVFKIQRHLGGDVRVIDRNLLILEVFDKRAMTKEAKLQIRLAKLKYTLSWGREFIKLRGIMGEQLGWMGPGDYPFQEYYRAARKRISLLEHALDEVNTKKSLRRERRSELGFPTVALAGYTQSGKTTLFNRLTSENKSVGLGSFTTLTTFARKVHNSNPEYNSSFILVDSIGFIEDMHPIILNAFNSTLSEITDADQVILFVDASEESGAVRRKLSSMASTLEQIQLRSDLILCPNKIDLVTADGLEQVLDIVRKVFPATDIVPISAKTGRNVDALLSRLEQEVEPTRTLRPLSQFRAS